MPTLPWKTQTHEVWISLFQRPVMEQTVLYQLHVFLAALDL